MMYKTNTFQTDKKLAAVCGLFCPSCLIYMASSGDAEAVRMVEQLFDMKPEEGYCEGCRSSTRIAYCDTCKMFQCAAEKGLDFCGACPDYPCKDLKAFQSRAPHRIELWPNQTRIREAGYEQWFDEMLAHFACPECGVINSAYHLACRECGHTPSCAYVQQHREEIEAFLEESA